MSPRSTLLVLNYNGRELLAEYLPSVVEAASYGEVEHEVVVVDNASTDDSVIFIRRRFPSVRVWEMEENRRLFSYNQAVARCETDYVVLLNNDIQVEPSFIPALLQHFGDPQVFAVMPQVLCDKPGEQYVYRCPGRFEYGVMSTGRDEQLSGLGYTLFAHGGAAACDRQKFLALGGFDTLYWTEYYEDVDLSYRAWMRGWVIIFEPSSTVFHAGGSTVDRVYTQDRKRRQKEKVRGLFVLKNIADRKMLNDFLLWTILRLGKAVATLDLIRLKAYWDIVLLLPRTWQGRRKVQKERLLSDRDILQHSRHTDD